MKIAPVHVRDRWIDDGDPIELWDEARGTGVRLSVVRTADLESGTAVMQLRRITMDDSGDDTFVVLDFSSGELRLQGDPGDALAPPLDLAWLRGQIDDELRAAIEQRRDRQPRADDLQGWRDGDQPRVGLGERAEFAQLFPAAWDVVAGHAGKRYALIDSYRVVLAAKREPLAIEIVDLEARASIGTAEIDLAVARNPPDGPRRRPPWRSSGPVVDRVLSEFREDADRWYELIHRAEIVARTAAVMQTWESDLRDPDAVVTALLAKLDDADEALRDRVQALKYRCIPALRRALDGSNEETSRYAARMLAALGDASGIDQLIAALGAPGGDPDPESFSITDAIGGLGAQAVDPLLTALASTQDRDAQDRLLDAVIATNAHDARIRDLLVGIVRADPGRASRLGDYGDRDPAVIALLVELLQPRVDALRGDLDDDDDAFDDAFELAQALRELGSQGGPVQQFDEIAGTRREAQLAAMRASRSSSAPVPYAPEPRYSPPAPVRVTPRPGRNEPCWCGSNKKYKKCHLEADEAAGGR